LAVKLVNVTSEKAESANCFIFIIIIFGFVHFVILFVSFVVNLTTEDTKKGAQRTQRIILFSYPR